MFDRDSWRNSANVVHPRLVHAVEELPHVRTESFDVTALAFGVNRFERERGFPGAARAGDNGHFPERKIDIDPFEIVLARSANLHTGRRGLRSDAFSFGNL